MNGAIQAEVVAEWHTVQYFAEHLIMITLEVKDMWGSQICMKRKQNYQSHFLNKPPYAERHVRWCERAEGVTPHPTR